ncbi:hypothetical protein ACE6H2_011163 [Prunus campanulata]
MSTDIQLPSGRSTCLTQPHESRGRSNRVVLGLRIRPTKCPLNSTRIAARVTLCFPRSDRTCHSGSTRMELTDNMELTDYKELTETKGIDGIINGYT